MSTHSTSYAAPSWRPYDPSWLVLLALDQRPDLPWLAAALAKCTRCLHTAPHYLHFVAPQRANQPGASWQFHDNVFLSDPEHGEVALDVLSGGRVGGVEFLERDDDTTAALPGV